MMKRMASLLVAVSLLMFSAPLRAPKAVAGEREAIGAILGGIAGGVIGSRVGRGRGRTVAIIGGSILGVLIGGSIGRQLDERDRHLMARSTQDTLEAGPTGTRSEWVNPDSGHRGTVQPVRTYRAESGQYCREFQQTVTIGGRTERAYGNACRQPDGSWRVQP